MSDARPTIVLVHGLAIVQHAGRMFDGVPEVLESQGFRVIRTIVQGDGSLVELADRLWSELARIEGPLVLLCHSMGGLQARTFLLDDTRASKLRAIATVGSPHAGTPLARPAIALNRAYADLTVGARTQWNHAHAETERTQAAKFGIRRISAVAKTSGVPHTRAMKAGWLALRASGAGVNDGLVPAASQRWGEPLFEVDLDHAETVGLGVSDARRPAVNELWLRLASEATRETSGGTVDA